MKLAFCFFIGCLLFCTTAVSASSFAVAGISKDPLANVNKRLTELEQIKPLNQMEQEEIRIQVQRALQPYGYFQAQVKIIRGNKVLIQISPGPLTHIAAVTIHLIGEGAHNPQLLALLKTLPLHRGNVLLTTEYNDAKQSLNSAAEHLGYLHNSFKTSTITVDSHHNTAVIDLVFDTGPLFYFGQVQFDPTYLDPSLLHRYVPFQPGQPYSTEQILKFNNYLSESGYFSSVLVKPEIDSQRDVPINVHLVPVPKYSYTLGAGLGTDTGLRGRAGLYVIPVNKKGHQFNAQAQGSFKQNALQAQYLIPGKNPVVDQYSVTGNFSNLNYASGYSNAYLLSLAQQHHRDNFKRNLSLNALYETFNYTEQPHSHEFMLYPKAKFTFSKTQNTLFSPSGYNLTFNILGASKALLSETSFAQGLLDLKAAYMIEPWRLRVYGHVLQGGTVINDINKLPLSLALLLGAPII